jgi:hypothetical protein
MRNTEPKRGNTGQRAATAVILVVLAALLVPGGVIAGVIALATTGSWLTGLLFLGIGWAGAFASLLGAIATGFFAGKSFVDNSEADSLAMKAQENQDPTTDRFM